MTKQEQLEKLKKEIISLENEIAMEEKTEFLKNNCIYPTKVEFHHKDDQYYVSFSTALNAAPFIFKLDEGQLYNLLTVVHQTLEEHEMTEEEKNVMNLMNHFFHINNFRPIKVDRGPK